MGKNNVNKKFTVNLDINTEDAEKKVTASAEKIKSILGRALTDSLGVKELRDMANTINQMFESIGKNAPLDIEKYFKGNGSAEKRIKLLTDSLNELSNVMNQTKTGSGGNNSGITGDLTKDVQVEIEKLQKQKQELQDILDTINNPEGMSVKLSGKNKEQLEQLKTIKDEYIEARDAKQQFEKSNMTNTSEYLEAVGRYARASAMVKSAFQSEDLTDKNIDFLSTRENISILQESETFIENFHKNFATRIGQMKKIFSDFITNINTELGKIQKTDQPVESSTYDKLKKNLQEYYELKLKLKNVEEDSAEYNNLQDRQRAIQDEIYAMKELSEEQENTFYDLFDSIDAEDNLRLNDALTQFCNILKVDIPNGADQAASAATSAFTQITTAVDQATDASQKVENAALRIKKAFDMVHDADAEFRITFGGQGLDIRSGLAREIDQKTLVENYLANINQGITLGAHSHRGISSGWSVSDIRQVIESQFSGLSKVDAVFGDRDITSIDFSGVSKEIAYKILDAIEKDAQMKLSGELKASGINRIAKQFGAGDIAKYWDVSEGADDFAKYIYDIEAAAQNAIEPVDRLKNLLTYLKPDIDLSKYDKELNAFANGTSTVTDVFNRISKSEGIGTIVDNTNFSSLSDVAAKLTQQQEEYQQKLLDTEITYKEILDMVQQVQDAGTKRSDIENTFGKYFNTKDIRQVMSYFEQMTNPIDIADNIKNLFGFDEYDEVVEMLQSMTATEDSSLSQLQELLSKRRSLMGKLTEEDQAEAEKVNKAIEDRINVLEELASKNQNGAIDESQTTSINQAELKLKEFLALADEIHNKSFSDAFDATDNVEIGKYTERLNSAKAALDELGDQGQLTAEQLEQINSAFDVATRDLRAKTHTYDSYASESYSTYDYYDEYQRAQDLAERFEQENEQLRAQLADQEANRQKAQKATLDTGSSVVGDMSQASKQLEELHAKLVAVKEAVDAKTQAFEEEYVTVDAAVNAEVQSLQLLLQQLQDVLNTIGLINQAFTQANESIARLYGTKDIDIKEDAASNAAVEKSKEIINKQYALDSTVASTNKILGDILATINKEKDPGVQKELGTLISALTANINALKDATNGVIDHQKVQKTDTTKAMARIQDPEQRQIVSGIAKNSVEDLGTETEIESLQALANGLVKVEGAFKNANGQWEGFIVKVNEHNKAVDLAIKKHSTFANMLNNPKNVDRDDNPYQYSKEEVETRAQKHLDELRAQGKNATVQFKDSGRYTITILEEIDGLSKQIFQTFDENDKKIERTTVTMSNSQKEKLDRLQRQLIDNGVTNGLISDQDQVYNDYQKASDALDNMTSAYSQMDSLSDEQIAKWKQQIALVQQLGGQVEALVKQRGQDNEAKIFKSDRTKKLSKFDLDKAELQKNIAIPDNFNRRMDDTRSAIENATDADALKIAINNWEALKNEIKATATQQDLYIKKTKETKKTAPKQDTFTGRLATQKTDFAQYKQDVENATGVTDELKGKLVELENQLNSVGDADGLAKWAKSFKNVANEIKSKRAETATAVVKWANNRFRELDFKADANDLTWEQKVIVEKHKELLQYINEYNDQVSNGQKDKISNIEDINRTMNALSELIEKYKTKYKIENAGGSTTKKAYGTAQLQNFTGKYNFLMNRAGSVGLNSDVEAVQKLTNAYQHLQDVQAKFKVGEDTKSGVGAQKAEEFKQAQFECNRYAQELAKVIVAEEKLRADSESSGGKSAPVAEDFDVSIKGRAQALEDFVRTQYGASASIGKFNADMTKLSFVVKNGDGTITNMTASLNAARTAIYATAGGTEKATTSFGRFFDELKAKARGITTYLISMTGFQEIWQQVRQGVQYVREIDSALTELKKVTNETDATYSRFLQTASKTAGVVGSTVSELTTMAAEWARLGYSIEEAGKLAESTAILLNVSEFENATDASEALISTMQAFQYTADESQHVVDVLNEVGNNYAVSSDGIATALQDSASALMEAGNNFEQSVALIAAANKVVDFVPRHHSNMMA